MYHHYLQVVLMARIPFSLSLSHSLSLSLSPSVPIGSLVGPLDGILGPHRDDEFFAGLSTLVCPCMEIHRRTSLICSSLLFQQCHVCLVRLTGMFSEMIIKWSYSCCFVNFCFQECFKTACSILEKFSSNSERSFADTAIQ